MFIHFTEQCGMYKKELLNQCIDGSGIVHDIKPILVKQIFCDMEECEYVFFKLFKLL
jgi:hypothetical protein